MALLDFLKVLKADMFVSGFTNARVTMLYLGYERCNVDVLGQQLGKSIATSAKGLPHNLNHFPNVRGGSIEYGQAMIDISSSASYARIESLLSWSAHPLLCILELCVRAKSIS